MTTASHTPSVVVLSGGVGGARFAHGVSRALPPESLTVVVNTGDDFEHWGLSISPDLDTVMYTLADLADEARGWGLTGETFRALDAMKRYGGDDWFGLGDADLATHLIRSQALRSGESLTAITRRLCRANGVFAQIVPMSDGPCRTLIETAEHGTLPFQQWFVKHRAPAVHAVRFDGDPVAAPEAVAAIERADVILIGPSNPYVSIDPILTRPGLRAAMSGKVVVAVSPIVRGLAVKGPLAEMIPALAQRAPSPVAIAQHYDGLVTAMVVERGDEDAFAALDVAGRRVGVLASDTVMRSRADSLRLAREVLDFATGLRA
ncbi:MAG: 2-phospho-L-lactate transferase [Polyangiales bacterium]